MEDSNLETGAFEDWEMLRSFRRREGDLVAFRSKVIKIGDSLYSYIPSHIVKSLGINEDSRIDFYYLEHWHYDPYTDEYERIDVADKRKGKPIIRYRNWNVVVVKTKKNGKYVFKSYFLLIPKELRKRFYIEKGDLVTVHIMKVNNEKTQETPNSD